MSSILKRNKNKDDYIIGEVVIKKADIRRKEFVRLTKNPFGKRREVWRFRLKSTGKFKTLRCKPGVIKRHFSTNEDGGGGD